VSGVTTVYVKRNGQTSRHYHTDPECSNLPANHREVERSKVTPVYQKCGVCAAGHDTTFGDRECPVCGDMVDIQLGLHLASDACGGGDGD